MSEERLWRETPLIHSATLSENINASVHLKLENLQPSYSFKYRGISYFIQKAKEAHGNDLHCVIASGGNAGLAAACAARILEVRCTVFIPEGGTESTLALLKRENAETVVIGRFYAEALNAARDVVANDSNAVMVPAYDDQVVWQGHSSMVVEIKDQLQRKPDAIFCSVGGGGLLGGIILGCKEVGWDDVPIVTLETIGSDCFYRSITMNGDGFNKEMKVLPPGVELVQDESNNLNIAHFNGFSSKASGSLGASQPAAGVLKMALERTGGVRSYSIPDELSMEGVVKFATKDDHKMLVELACSTTLVPAYHPTLFDRMVPPRAIERCVVFVVCGGFKVSISDAVEFRTIVDEVQHNSSVAWEVRCDDGEILQIPK
ncbi:L-serine dehydratase/L-threonine deaminase [Leucoagaricus sp. SymC.cos]|nr:L-serine dehydratase/L-threonine deaminase [Leucoagaricus sp. SymC.cos]